MFCISALNVSILSSDLDKITGGAEVVGALAKKIACVVGTKLGFDTVATPRGQEARLDVAAE